MTKTIQGFGEQRNNTIVTTALVILHYRVPFVVSWATGNLLSVRPVLILVLEKKNLLARYAVFFKLRNL